MLTKSHAVLAGLALVAVHNNIRTQIDAKKAAKLYLNAHKAFEETEAANEAQIQYLCHMLDEHEIPLNEFDLIALHFNH